MSISSVSEQTSSSQRKMTSPLFEARKVGWSATYKQIKSETNCILQGHCLFKVLSHENAESFF